MKTILLKCSVVLCALSSLLCCGEKEPTEIEVESVRLSASSLELTVGDQKSLNATISPANATNKNISWTSSRPNVASVTSDGIVEGISAGTSVIIASSANGIKANCNIVVKEKVVPVTSITLDRATLTMTEGDTQTLTATVKPDDASDKTVTWTSSNTSVAKVDGGKVTAVAQGTATITAKAGDKTATCTVTVEKKVVPVTSITLDRTTLTMTEGDTQTLSATVKPDDASDKIVTWTSSNTSIATVDGGKVTAVAQGTATITAKAGDKTATCTVTVQKKVVPVTSITLDKATLTMSEGDTQTLTATVKPDDASDKTVTWTSSNTSVAKVDGGKVTAVAQGTATITAKAGDKTATCTVTVEKKVVPVTSITLDRTTLTMTEGDTQTLTATVKPDDASDKTVTWTSSNTSVAKVDGGKVTAVAQGTATITAKAGDKTATCAVTVNPKIVDTSGPVIVSFDFTPKKVNVEDSAQKVTFTIHLTDQTGVKPGFSITIFNPEYFLDTMQYADFKLKSGNKKDGIYEAVATIAKGAPTGNWTVGLSGLQDELGYQTFINNTTLEVIRSKGNTESIVDNGDEHEWD